jgi:hypothetical protein
MVHPHPTAAAVAADPPHKERRLGRARVSNDAGFLPKQPPSLFQQARRRRDLVDGFLHELGGDEGALSPLTLMRIRTAAELTTAAEMCRAALLNGQVVNVHELLRLEGCASRAVRVLGLKIEKPLPGLQRARARWDAQARPENTKTKVAKAATRREKPSQRRERPDDDEAQETD